VLAQQLAQFFGRQLVAALGGGIDSIESVSIRGETPAEFDPRDVVLVDRQRRAHAAVVELRDGKESPNRTGQRLAMTASRYPRRRKKNTSAPSNHQPALCAGCAIMHPPPESGGGSTGRGAPLGTSGVLSPDS
jgi:hypothetical protein